MTIWIRPGEVWRHVKRGTEYRILYLAVLHAQDNDLDEELCVVYQGSDEAVWVRTVTEFCDGRFEKVKDQT